VRADARALRTRNLDAIVLRESFEQMGCLMNEAIPDSPFLYSLNSAAVQSSLPHAVEILTHLPERLMAPFCAISVDLCTRISRVLSVRKNERDYASGLGVHPR